MLIPKQVAVHYTDKHSLERTPTTPTHTHKESEVLDAALRVGNNKEIEGTIKKRLQLTGVSESGPVRSIRRTLGGCQPGVVTGRALRA